jgi:adenylate cyclase
VIRRVRLGTGLILFAYVATHLLNHALGLISFRAMELGRVWFLALWRNPVGTTALYGALLVHFSLALWAIYERRRLRYSATEFAQLLLGLSIPLLLAEHAVGTRLAHTVAGTNDDYAYVLLSTLRFDPSGAWYQSAALFAAWCHGCIGLYYWLRLKPWFSRCIYPLFAVALLLPVLSWLGYIEGGRQVLALAGDPAWLRATRAAEHLPDAATARQLYAVINGVIVIVLSGVALALLARPLRTIVERRRGILRISYPDGRIVSIAPGHTILDASRAGGIAHASVCGGRGRCSTCRIRVTQGTEYLPPPNPDERRVLDRIGSPPHVRLACQTRPHGDVSVLPLLPPTASAHEGHPRPAWRRGQEREIVILFADLRDFTGFSERKLPYDVVFVLNRYFAAMGEAVIQAGGHLDKFIGDGVMALFGIDSTPQAGSRQALAAARAMAERLAEINRSLADDLDAPLRIGIGLHAGPAIIGEMGYGQATTLTAVGDAVNIASRLESLTKEYRAQLVLSEAVAIQAGVDLSAFESHELPIRGRSEMIRVRVVVNALDLPTIAASRSAA